MNTRRLAPGLGLTLLLATAACERPASPSADAPPAEAPAASVGSDAADAVPGAGPASSSTDAAAAPLGITDAQVKAEFSSDLARCLDTGAAANGVSIAMGGCFNAELQAQDTRLNAAYRNAMAARDGADKARLRAEERVWISERDAGCREAATGGTIDLVEIPGCLLTETVRRRLVLETLSRPG